MNTLEQLPRTPKDAGLIGVALKRKMEFKNIHKHQLVNPEKIFKMLNKLKTDRNPYYKFKYQFKYNESLCMTNKYPEISVNTTGSVNVAPGEGQIPKDMMAENDWDIKAFPHLHNSDGSNGKDQD